jgi:hypothetical protein
MATSLAPPNASGFDGGGGGIDSHDIHSELGQTLQSAIPEDLGGEETPGGEAGSEHSEFTPPVEETPGGEAPTSEAAEGATEPYPLSEDGKNYLIPKEQLADYTGLREYSTEVQNYFPTVSDAKVAAEFSTDFRSMQYDYESGDPANIDRTLQYWAGANAQDPYTRQRFQESFATMAQRMPQLLQQVNPQAHQQLAKTLAQNIVEKAYLDASTIADNDEREAAFLAAKGMDWVLNRKYRTELPKHDPAAAAQQAQQQAERQRLQGIEQREAQLLDRDFKAFDASMIDGPKINAVWAEIDKVLAPVKAKYDEADYAELRNGLMADLTKTLKSGSNAEWFSTHTQEYQSLQRMFQKAWKSGQDPKSVLGQRAEYYKNDLLVRARRALPSLAAPRISKATASRVTNPKTATARPRTQNQPPAATPEKNGNQQHYSLQEDPEFGRMFKV